MAEPKTKPTNVDINDFIDSFCDKEWKRQEARTLVQWMEAWTGYPPVMWGPSIIGFGKYHYRSNKSKQQGEWPLVGFSPRKAAFSLYVYSGNQQHLPLVEALGKYTKSKACIYVKRLADIDENVLKQLVLECVKYTQEKFPDPVECVAMESPEKWMHGLEQLAAIVAKTPLIPVSKWGIDVYTYNNRNVLAFLGFKDFFSLWFYNGVFLSDPYQVLVSASDGKTKSLRQWRFTNVNDIQESRILEYIREAIHIEEQGLKIAPERFQAIAVPSLLQSALDAMPQLAIAFQNLSPGKQKEYCVYMAEPKQETTRERRLEKIIPMILSRVGLNDEYKKG